MTLGEICSGLSFNHLASLKHTPIPKGEINLPRYLSCERSILHQMTEGREQDTLKTTQEKCCLPIQDLYLFILTGNDSIHIHSNSNIVNDKKHKAKFVFNNSQCFVL